MGNDQIALLNEETKEAISAGGCPHPTLPNTNGSGQLLEIRPRDAFNPLDQTEHPQNLPGITPIQAIDKFPDRTLPICGPIEFNGPTHRITYKLTYVNKEHDT